ncbi:MAG: hypothetical protein J6K92_02005 [Oscillospiraceae bacterium]|nr:hypothetical protein [Oscillospiraceae bacterium]
MLSAVLIIIGIALIIISVWAEKESRKRKSELHGFTSNAVKHNAIVLDCPEEKGKKSVIIQIRIEEQHRTLVHRCEEPFFKAYKRGDVISVYLIEEMPADRSLIEGDNRYERFIRTEGLLRLPARIIGGAAAVLGMIFLFI